MRGYDGVKTALPFFVIASVSEAINRVEIPCSLIATLVTLARNDTWNLVMLRRSRNISLPLLTDSNLPATARNVYVRAKRHNIDAALWGMGI
ncbi:MAG: hypothetical protein K2N54_05815, partial [Helicobacter sp.]|nr:hypothetical protein [Helicobacter sp.]